jgi:hypothetical protein
MVRLLDLPNITAEEIDSNDYLVISNIKMTNSTYGTGKISLAEFAKYVFGSLYSDSDVISLVDSAYINERITLPPAYGDSDVISLVDSAYVQIRSV